MICLIVIIPLSFAYKGNSSSYEVTVTGLSMISFEETIFQTIAQDTSLNMSVEINLQQMPIYNGTSALYEVLPGLGRLLGTIAFNATIKTIDGSQLTPYSTINCTGYNIFSMQTMLNGWYRFTDENTLSTTWNSSGIFSCGYMQGSKLRSRCTGNITCHYKVDDSYLNSTEVNVTLSGMNTPPIITSINLTPLTSYKNDTLNCTANATDIESNPITLFYSFINYDTNDTLQNFSTNKLFDCKTNINCTKHTNITCLVIAGDQYSNSTENASNIVEIKNTPPTFNQLITNDSVVKISDGINLTAKNVYDEDNDSVRLECGDISNSNNLCNGTFYQNKSELSCLFNSPWNDNTNHTVFCKLYDQENKSNVELNLTILADNIKPSISLITPLNNSVWNQSLSINYIFNVSDTNNVTYCELTVNNIVQKNSTNITKDTNQSLPYYTVLNGLQYWNITCIDEAGNKNTTITYNVNKTTQEAFFLTNIGFTGFENISQEYTYTRLVILNTILSPTASECIYVNENSNLLNDWESCTLTKEWFLTEYDGLKNVTVLINHTGIDNGIIINLSDTINLQSNATNLDTTPPEKFNITDEGDYSNKNTTFTASWQVPFDYETLLTNGKIVFDYELYDNTTSNNITNWVHTENTSIVITNLSLLENHTYVLIVNATNPAGYTTQSRSDGIIIDLTPPNITNITSDKPISVWTNNNSLIINFTATDNISGVKGYSIILDSQNDTIIEDDTTETISNSINYTPLDNGVYYVHVKAYDNANNFGNTSTIGPIMIDTTNPTKPVVYNPTKYAINDSLFFEWSASIDDLSGVKYYTVIAKNILNNVTTEKNTTNTSIIIDLLQANNNYYAQVIAYDYAGNFMSSILETDKVPIKIDSVTPDNNVIVKSDPIIKVWTSKEGICFVDEKIFLYTNSRYHETKISRDGSVTTKIRCEDNLGYQANKTITYTVNKNEIDSLVFGSVTNNYVRKTMSVEFNMSTKSIAQISKQDIEVYLNDTPINDYSVENIDNTKAYVLKLVVNKPGSYVLKIKFGGLDFTKNIDVLSKILTINYNTNTENTDTNMISSNYNGKTIGIASDADIKSKSDISSNMNMKIDETGKMYIFFTKKDVNTKVKNQDLKYNTFDKTLNAFGYAKSDEYIIGNTLIYDYLVINQENKITTGSHNIFIRNLGTTNNKTNISIEIE